MGSQVLLGGINGPFHSAMAATLARRPRSEAGPIVEAVSTVVGAFLLPAALATFLLAGPLIDAAAPGLALNGAAGAAARAVAVLQLQARAAKKMGGGGGSGPSTGGPTSLGHIYDEVATRLHSRALSCVTISIMLAI